MSPPPRADEAGAVPLVSFLIVSFNAGSYLREAVASAFGQTYPRIEVVLVDNASTDGSVDELERELGGAREIRIVRSPDNRGPFAGAWLGLPLCRGEFIARLDADDVALPGRIAEQVGYLRRRPDKDAVGGDVLRVDPAGRPLSLGLSLPGEFMRRHAAKWEMGCPHTTFLVRRSAAAERFYNPTLFAAGDLEWIEWIARHGRLGRLPRILCLYRQHEFSITRRLGKLQRLSSCEIKTRLSAATEAERQDLATADLGFLQSDRRVKLRDRQCAQLYEEAAREKRDWLAAAYLASIQRGWVRVPGALGRAWRGGRAWREVAALALCRSAWPVWQRMHNLGFKLSRGAWGIGTGKRASIGAGLLVAGRLNAWRAALPGTEPGPNS